MLLSEAAKIATNRRSGFLSLHSPGLFLSYASPDSDGVVPGDYIFHVDAYVARKVMYGAEGRPAFFAAITDGKFIVSAFLQSNPCLARIQVVPKRKRCHWRI